jgi:hypothetical protein
MKNEYDRDNRECDTKGANETLRDLKKKYDMEFGIYYDVYYTGDGYPDEECPKEEEDNSSWLPKTAQFMAD